MPNEFTDTAWWWDGVTLQPVEVADWVPAPPGMVTVFDEDEIVNTASKGHVYSDSATAVNAMFQEARLMLAAIELVYTYCKQQGGDQMLSDKVADAKRRYDEATTVEEVKALADELDTDTLDELTRVNENDNKEE